YSSNFIFNPEGKLISRHRKIKGLNSEQVLWDDGLLYEPSIVEIKKTRVATLIGSEAYLPLLRASYYQEGASMYFMPACNDSLAWQNCILHTAKEARSFVFSCNQFITKDMYPKDINHSFSLSNYPKIINRGGSAIIDPEGNYLVGPIYDKEAILVADIDLEQIQKSRYDLDPAGHFRRDDIFELTINYKIKKDI
ncbi:MAG: nitrilase-related carbon-nitrogen hydrolase, partial [Bacilli bacterium]